MRPTDREFIDPHQGDPVHIVSKIGSVRAISETKSSFRHMQVLGLQTPPRLEQVGDQHREQV
jgi:hypothetical protein